MKYFIIAGEASGDLHGAQLIAALKQCDPDAQIRFYGGDQMEAAAGTAPLTHYRDMAYMGFIEVAKHLPTILGFLAAARRAIDEWQPDAVVLIDYPSFNLKVAKHARNAGRRVFYFISPKVWAWKQWRVKDIKRYVNHMYSILPFEVEFYRTHHYEVDYVGNPTVTEIAHALGSMPAREDFLAEHGLDAGRPLIALVPGSRVKEIRDNLPSMLAAASRHPHCQLAVAGAPNIDHSLYAGLLQEAGVSCPVVSGATWALVRHAQAAVVTSGTATLETALLGTPQVACYRMNGSKWVYRFYSHLIHGKYVTLPNLIADEPVIPELLMHHCTPHSIDSHLAPLLDEHSPERKAMLAGYERMRARLGTDDCAAVAARSIVSLCTA